MLAQHIEPSILNRLEKQFKGKANTEQKQKRKENIQFNIILLIIFSIFSNLVNIVKCQYQQFLNLSPERSRSDLSIYFLSPRWLWCHCQSSHYVHIHYVYTKFLYTISFQWGVGAFAILQHSWHRPWNIGQHILRSKKIHLLH